MATVENASPGGSAPLTQEQRLARADALMRYQPNDLRALKANPTGVVMEAWKSLESILRNTAARADKNVFLSDRLTLPSLIKYLQKHNFLTSNEIDTIFKLKSMRDLAAHSRESIEPESADTFFDIANRMSKVIGERVIERGW